MIDSHCHLDHEPLKSDLSNIIKRSKDVGIEKLLIHLGCEILKYLNIQKIK